MHNPSLLRDITLLGLSAYSKPSPKNIEPDLTDLIIDQGLGLYYISPG